MTRNDSKNAILILRRLWSHLSPRRKYQIGLLLPLMIFGAFLEMVSLGAIVPFLGVLAAPDHVFEQPYIAQIAHFWGATSAQQMLLPLAILFAVAVLCSAAMRVFLLWANTRLSYTIGGEFSIEGYRRTLYQPYAVHVARNSSVAINDISKKIGIAIAVLYQTLILISSTVLTIAVVGALIWVDPKITLSAAIIFGFFYLVIARYSRQKLVLNSQRIAFQEDQAVKILQEGLGGVRDVLIDGTQEVYRKKYAQVAVALRQSQSKNVFLGGAPRYLMEALGMLGIVALAYSIVARGGTQAFAVILPALGAFALGAQKLLPTLQQIYAAWAGITGNYKIIVDVLDMLEQPVAESGTSEILSPLQFQQQIQIASVSYQYISEGPWVLENVSITIPKGARVGIMGSTGSGKSTLVDLFMGLLMPITGKIIIDHQPITLLNLRRWQQCLAHVPQNIFLSDATIAENIAFGVPLQHIDMQRVCEVARQAQLSDFIETRLGGYHALVGERGVKLSGGQRQRIGIARALYKQAPVLILDEATSALDNQTEEMVMQTLDNLDKNLTILIVAHRLTTLKQCNRIIELVNGQAVQHDSYQRMLASREPSRSLS